MWGSLILPSIEGGEREGSHAGRLVHSVSMVERGRLPQVRKGGSQGSLGTSVDDDTNTQKWICFTHINYALTQATVQNPSKTFCSSSGTQNASTRTVFEGKRPHECGAARTNTISADCSCSESSSHSHSCNVNRRHIHLEVN